MFRRVGQYAGFAPAAILYGFFFTFPLVLIVCYAFWDTANFQVVERWSFENFEYLVGVSGYRSTFLATLATAAIVTLITLAIAFPAAYWLARYVPDRWQRFLLVLIVFPFLASYLLRVYAWIAILDANGLINGLIEAVGVREEPAQLLYNRPAVIAVLIYLYFPFALVALYAALKRFEMTQMTAAMDLGASWGRAFRRVMLPQIRPGIMTAAIFVFVPVLGEYLVPQLIGGANASMFGNLVATYFQSGEFTRGAAAALLLTALIVVLLVVFRRALELRGADVTES